LGSRRGARRHRRVLLAQPPAPASLL
jgi:hypothetical protein